MIDRQAITGVETRFARAMLGARTVPFASRPDETNPAGYYTSLLSADDQTCEREARRRLAFRHSLFRFARRRPEGLRVLEAGSGFGLGQIADACLGALPVGLEIVPWQAEWARRCASELGFDQIEVEIGSVSAMPFADESFDVVFSIEALSHYLDYRPFIREARRVLKPTGVLVVSDSNNGLNPVCRHKTSKVWASHETEDFTADHPFHFVAKRERIALESGVPPEDARRLALLTSGMVRGQVEEAARRYLENGALPDSPYRRGQLTVHPEHEMVMERLFNPYRLAADLRQGGFSTTRVRGHWAGVGREAGAVRAANAVLAAATPLTIFSARGFRIAAEG